MPLLRKTVEKTVIIASRQVAPRRADDGILGAQVDQGQKLTVPVTQKIHEQTIRLALNGLKLRRLREIISPAHAILRIPRDQFLVGQAHAHRRAGQGIQIPAPASRQSDRKDKSTAQEKPARV